MQGSVEPVDVTKPSMASPCVSDAGRPRDFTSTNRKTSTSDGDDDTLLMSVVIMPMIYSMLSD